MQDLIDLDPGDFADLASRKWAEDSYKFFGLQPYWTDEGYKTKEHSTTPREMKEEKAKDATKTDESKRLFYEYEPLWPIL